MDPIWNRSGQGYESIGQWLRDRGEVDPIVMVNDPPSFTYHTGIRSIVVPFGDVQDLLSAARQFSARWVVLDQNRPAALAALYADPVSDPRLKWQATLDQSEILEIVP